MPAITDSHLDKRFIKISDFCRVVNWDWVTMNVYDKHFNPLVEQYIGHTIVLADYGFRKAGTHTVPAGTAWYSLEVADKCPEWGIESCPYYKRQKRRFFFIYLKSTRPVLTIFWTKETDCKSLKADS